MAYKSFTKLPLRNQSTLISQLHKLINYYAELFSSRERVYLKNLSKIDKTIYWLENQEKLLTAAAIVDPNYKFKVNDIEVLSLGHLLSKSPGQMDRLLSHIYSDYEDKSIILISRKSIAESIQPYLYDLVELTPLNLISVWPELATTTTDYFNASNEELVMGLERKQQLIYFRLAQKDKQVLEGTNPKLLKFIEEKQQKQA